MKISISPSFSENRPFGGTAGGEGGSMTQGLSVPVSCCGCGRRYCGRSRRKTLWDDVMNLLGWYAWRCGGCGTRFYLRRELNDPYARIGPVEKGDSAGRQGVGPSPEKKAA